MTYIPPEVADSQEYRGRKITIHRATPDVALHIDGQHQGVFLTPAGARKGAMKIVDHMEKEKREGAA